MAEKILKWFIAIGLIVFFWQAYDIMNMTGMNKEDCEARGGQIITHENGNSVCRYVRS